MGVITTSGRELIASSVASGGLHLAWGQGGSWTTPPAENIASTGLIAELGRRIPEEISFVVPDSLGDIILQSGRYSRSNVPTRWLFVLTQFGFNEEPAAIVREIGLFKGSQFTNPGVGQKYFVASQVSNPGKMLHVQNLAPIIRSNLNREVFPIVIQF